MDKIENLLPYVKLKFNIEYPMLDECYQFGYECAEAKIEEEHNPFEPGTAEHDYWSEGWWDAFYEAEKHLTPATVTGGVELNAAAANDALFGTSRNKFFFKKFLKITMVLAASALISYQVLDLVA